LGIVLIVKPVTALVIVILSRRAWRTGLAVAGGLAQIGEFSFILAEMAKSLKLMPGEGHDVLVAVAIVSISLNPFVFRGLMALEPWMTRNRWLSRGTDARGEKINARAAALAKEPERVRAIVVGYGPGGRTVTRLLREFDINPTIIEMNVDTVIELQGSGGRALYGDATRASLLTEAGIGTARYLIVTVPDADTSLAVITAARSLNAEVRILTRARFLRE